MERFIHEASLRDAKNESFHARAALSSLASGSEPFEGTRSEIDLECIARIASI